MTPKEEKMGASIVDIKNMGDALRSSGYKDIESAVSEIIDNSVEADAKNVFVILKDKVNPTSGKKNICEIAFLDDGCGMDNDILGKCLGLGVSTRRERKGMGRFGVGLPQASLYACPEVYVYSWQNSIENAQYVYLDINKVKEGLQTEIPDPKAESLPKDYADYIHFHDLYEQHDFSKNGTLVVWKNCDRVQPKTISALKERLEFSIGQKFRYFIHDKKCSIKIFNNSNKDTYSTVFPNDPLFLMEDNYALGNPDKPKELFERGKGENLEPIFEPYNDKINKCSEHTIPVKFINKKGLQAESNVIVRFSIVKSCFYDKTAFPTGNPGDAPIGKYAKKMEGISIIRAGREIDFGQFDFYDNENKPTDRWWGCEILFNPELDEIFGVSNNKQHVELRQQSDNSDYEEVSIWDLLKDMVKGTIGQMRSTNKSKQEGVRSMSEPRLNITSTIVGNVETDEDDGEKKETECIREATAPNVLEAKGKVFLENLGIDSPSQEEIRQFLNSYVYFDYTSKNKSKDDAPFDCHSDCGNLIISINKAHKFYTEFLERIYEKDDAAKISFELFLAAFYCAVDKTNSYQAEENDKLISRWKQRLSAYIDEQLNPTKG